MRDEIDYFYNVAKAKDFDFDQLLKNALKVLVETDCIVFFPGWYQCFGPDWWIEKLTKTKILELDARHINVDANNVEESFFWEIEYDPTHPEVYAHSKERQPLHTDNSWFKDAAELSFFIFDTAAPSGGESTFYPLDRLVDDLQSKEKMLFDDLTSVPVTIQKSRDEEGNNTLILNLQKMEINWNYYRVLKQDDAVKEMCDAFFDFLNANETSQSIIVKRFKTNDCYLLPDRKFLHGRKSFVAEKKGDRKLLHSQWKYIC